MACVVKRRGKYVLDYRDQYNVRHWESTDGNKKEAEAILAKRLIEIGKGSYVAPKDRNITFKEFADQWLSTRDGKIRPITLSQYNDHLTLHLLPFFGPVRVNRIDVSLIDAYSAKKQEEAAELERQAAELTEQANIIINKVKSEGREMTLAEKMQHSRLSSESRSLARKAIGIPTINKTITTLGSVLKYAVRCKIIEGNSVRDVERPKMTALAQADTDESDEMQILTTVQIRGLLEAASDSYRTLFQTAVLTGMRSEEFLALQWGDIDWTGGQVLVRRVLTRTKKDGWKFYDPKTKNSKRRIDVDPSLLLELKKWKMRSAKTECDDLVFPSPTGQPMHRSTLYKMGFLPAIRRSGIPRIGLHGLRHTYASLLIAQGEHPKYIQAQMGHASINITMDVYGHLMEKVNVRSASRLAMTVFGSEPEHSGSKMVANSAGEQV
jgi:integrase